MVYVYGQRPQPSPQRSPQQTQEARLVSKFKFRVACSGKFEIILHLACIVMVCVASLIPAAIAIETIGEIEEYTDSNNGILSQEQTDGYDSSYSYNDRYSTDGRFDAVGARAAAGWLICVCSAGIVIHFVGILVRIYYLITGMPKHSISYSVVVIVITIILGFAFIAGAVANGIQFASTASLDNDRCISHFSDTEVCQDLNTLISCQLACTILPPASMGLMYGLLMWPVCYGAYIMHTKKLEWWRFQPTTRSASQPRSAPTRSVRPPPRVEILPSAPPHSQIVPSEPPHSQIVPSAPPHSQIVPSAPSLNMQTNEPPIVSEDTSPSASKSPPPYESTFTEPPPYEVAIKSTDV